MLKYSVYGCQACNLALDNLSALSSTSASGVIPVYLIYGRKIGAVGQGILLIGSSVILDCFGISFVEGHGSVTKKRQQQLSASSGWIIYSVSMLCAGKETKELMRDRCFQAHSSWCLVY